MIHMSFMSNSLGNNGCFTDRNMSSLAASQKWFVSMHSYTSWLYYTSCSSVLGLYFTTHRLRWTLQFVCRHFTTSPFSEYTKLFNQVFLKDRHILSYKKLVGRYQYLVENVFCHFLTDNESWY